MTMWSKKKFGFGLMRLPKNGEEIDIPATISLADEFVHQGFTYFDTAFVYPGSEEAFREAVAKRYPRNAYTLANKMAGWMLRDDFGPEEMFNESLKRCGVDYFDYYLLHSLQPSRMAAYDKYDCWQFCQKKKTEGKIKNFGFSYHGDPVLLEEILTNHPEVDFVQLQINYVDWEDNVIFSGRNYEICEKYGKDIVVMEPVKGGILASMNPELLQKFQAIKPEATAASYALRFVGSLPKVKMILSGMNTLEQMKENLETFNHFEPLSDIEQNAIQEVTAGLRSIPTVPCTDCRYCCKGCPKGIRIPDIFKAYNLLLTFGEHNRPHFYYSGLLQEGSGKANECIECGQCEAACPQHIQIVETLKKASALLDQ